MKIFIIGLCFLFQFAAITSPAQTVLPANFRFEGVVRDEQGASVVRADVSFVARNPALNLQTKTDENGRFIFESVSAQTGKLIINSEGFAGFQRELNFAEILEPLEIVLSPADVSAEVTVTRSAARLEETPASIVALSRAELETTAAATLDDKLRQVPGFSLFRRAGSRTANPTSQGISLRGIGASGASRAAVLVDNVPLNDPFGGWIYWGRVPRESIARVEVLRGAASELYGSGAVGGVVSIVTRKPAAKPVFDFEVSGGNQNTADASFYASSGVNQWSASVSADFFNAGGFVIVDKPVRGFIDTPAGVRSSSMNLVLERSFADGNRIFASGSLYDEDRQNGTPLQTNDTYLRGLTIGGDWKFQKSGALIARIYGNSQTYNQAFSAIAADRNSENLSRRQRVPAQVVGLTAQWSQAFGTRNNFVGGIDAREVRGRSDETIFSNNRATSAVSAGGREFTFGVFATDIFRVSSRLFLSGGLRFDRWQNFAASSTTKSLIQNSAAVVTIFPKRIESAFSPRASLLYRLSKNFSLTGSFAKAFRQPTLNELYRSFRVGDALTLANENLIAERAASGEAGLIANGYKRRLFVRSNFFWTEISRPVANVTLNSTPTLITRQRQNLGKTRSRGLELDADFRLTNNLVISGGYLFVDPRVVSFPANRDLENRLIPQVARHQLSLQAQYQNSKIGRFGVQARAASSQFDDDQNRFRLNSYFTLDATAARRLNRNLELFLAAENLFDNRIETGRTPVVTLGSPRTLRLGLRFSLNKK